MSEPLLVEIIAYAPTAFYHCTHCEVAWSETGRMQRVHEEQLENSLPLDLIREYQTISDWVRGIFQAHCDRVVVKVIDAASIEGVCKSLRYGTRRFPAVIVNAETRFSGINSLASASHKIADLLAVPVSN
ncbi:MAG TPA: hypothetical protein VLX61_10030 [Anaerolineales bacterium]|nr:hypothetical protein [Anaerolineales bacterium]